METREVLSATFGSAVSIGGPTSDAVWDIAADGAGNSYVTGYFTGTVDFDLDGAHLGDADILTARGETDAFVAKYAADDSLMWVRRMGGDYFNPQAITDVGRQIAVDTSGNVYVVGEFFGSADFGANTLVSEGTKDGFVAKFDAAGSLAWARQLATVSISRGVDFDAQGNVYALTLRDSTGFDVMKFTASGASKWTKSLVTNNSYSGDLTVSANGNVYVVGSFWNTVDFDPGPKTKYVSVGQRNAVFTLKLDTNGSFGWVTPFSGTGQVYAYTVSADNSGNVLVGGSYTGSVDFNPSYATTTLNTAGGGYVAKLNSSGRLAWAKAFVGGYVSSVDVDAAGNAYVTGTFASSIDLDPGSAIRSRTTTGGNDIFVVKLTSAGNYSWGQTFGGIGDDRGWGIAVDTAGYVHVAGWFADSVDFDSDPLGTEWLGTPGGGRNGFRLRLQQT